MNEKEVRDEIDALQYVELEKLNPFQGSLKEIKPEALEALIQNILEFGFSSPCLVWKNDGKYHILDAHMRKLALETLKERGIKVPDKIPCVLIKAKDEKEAKKKILSLSSNYGHHTKRGLQDFFIDNEIKPEDVKLNFLEFDTNDVLLTDEDDPTSEDESGDEEEEALTIICKCKTLEERVELFERLISEGFDVRVK